MTLHDGLQRDRLDLAKRGVFDAAYLNVLSDLSTLGAWRGNEDRLYAIASQTIGVSKTVTRGKGARPGNLMNCRKYHAAMGHLFVRQRTVRRGVTLASCKREFGCARPACRTALRNHQHRVSAPRQCPDPVKKDCRHARARLQRTRPEDAAGTFQTVHQVADRCDRQGHQDNHLRHRPAHTQGRCAELQTRHHSWP